MNQTIISGVITNDVTYGHSVMGEAFYEFILASKRKSETSDYIKIVISERIIKPELLIAGTTIRIEGEFHSMNYVDETGKRRLDLFVFAKDASIIDNDTEHENNIELEGFICREPSYRFTPKNRQITDLLLAVNRNYSKSDYVPVITWGRCAKYIKDYPVGTKVKLKGRLQSRIYHKQVDDTIQEYTAYEVSAMAINVV